MQRASKLDVVQREFLRKNIREKALKHTPTNTFGFKSWRNGEFCYVYPAVAEFIDPIENKFPKRPDSKKDFTVTGTGTFSRIPNKGCPFKTPLYTPEEKAGFTNNQSISLGAKALYPKIFGFTKERKDILVGIFLDFKDILLSDRLFIYDGGTYDRPYDFYSVEKAIAYEKEKLNKKLFSKKQLKEFLEVVRKNLDTYNEVLARIRWACDGTSKIFIGTDNLESRLLAVQYANILSSEFKKYGKCGSDYKVPIIFYTPDNLDLIFKEYTYDEYLLDVYEARCIYEDLTLRASRYRSNQYEFLFILSPTEIANELHTNHLSITLLLTGYVHMFRFLSEKGKLNIDTILDSISTETEYQKTLSKILEHAARAGNMPITTAVLKRINHTQSNDAIFQAVKSNLAIAKLLISSKKFDLEVKKDGETFLWWAVRSKNKEIIQSLLNSGVNIEAKCLTNVGYVTVLILTVTNDLKEITKLLLQHGANTETIDNYGYTPLIWAVKKGKLETVNFLLQHGANAGAKDSNGDTALIWAKEKGNLEITKLLLQHGVNTEAKDRHGDTSLIWAVEKGKFETVKLLLQHGANAEAKDCNDDTALIWAVKKGKLETVKFLLKIGFSTETKDKDENTALICAVKLGNRKVIELLLKKGAKIEAKDKDKNTALILVSEKGDLSMVQLLLDNGANTKAKNEARNTALILAVKKDHIEIVLLLLKYNAHIESKDSYENTALFWAVNNKNSGLVKLLLEYNANPEVPNKFGDTPFLLAVKNRDADIIELLLKKVTNINQKNKEGETALICAIKQGHGDIVKLLLENGADIETKNSYGDTPLILAVMHACFDIVKLLLDRGANTDVKNNYGDTALIQACYHGHVNMTKLLLDRNANTDQKNNEGDTALICAVKNNDYAILALLLSINANTELKDGNGHSALILAIKNDHTEIAKLLLERNANIEEKEKDGNSALMLALKKGNIKLAKLLLNKNADPECKDNDNNTPLILAAKYNYVEIALLLLDKDVNINNKNKEGETALSLAILLNHAEIEKLIENTQKAKEIVQSASIELSKPIAFEIAKIFACYAHPPLFTFNWRRHCDLADEIAKSLYAHKDWDFDKCYQYIIEQLNCIPKDNFNSTGTFAGLLQEITQLGKKLKKMEAHPELGVSSI